MLALELASTESKLEVARGGLAIVARKAFGLDLGFTFSGDGDFDCFHGSSACPTTFGGRSNCAGTDALRLGQIDR